MSLLVWLPLNGDLRNNGLAETSTISTSNLSFVANGKIGKCMSGYTGYFSVPSMANKKQLSVAYWVRINTATATNWLDAFTWYSTDGTTSQTSRNEFYTNSTYTGFWFAGSPNSISGKKNTVGAWQHHAFVIDYSTGTSEFFINGVSVGKTTGVYTTHYLTGNNFRIGENGLDASYNDFRLYDHALSDREVKELSRGLVAHWKLDDFVGNPNQLKSNPLLYTPTAYNAYRFDMTENLVANQTYTLQLWDVDISHSEKTAEQLAVNVYWGGGSVFLFRWYIPSGHSNYLAQTFTVTETQASHSTAVNPYLNLYNSTTYVAGTMNMRVGKWKLEKGEVATSWIPSSADDMYSDWEFNVAHDSSGYCHDGEQIGDVSVSSSTPRYLSGMHIESLDYATNRYNINLSCLKMPIEMITPEELTIAFWGNLALGYGNGWQGVFSFSNSTWPTDYLAAAINQYDSNFCFNSSDGSSHVRLTNNLITVAGEWHHYALTYDGKTCRAYRDGELKTSGTFSADTALGSFAHLFMGLSVAGSVWRKNTCDYSDVRVYATALSADDIKELYNTSASIDNHHNVYARELVED